jgi:hypothetical protein
MFVFLTHTFSAFPPVLPAPNPPPPSLTLQAHTALKTAGATRRSLRRARMWVQQRAQRDRKEPLKAHRKVWCLLVLQLRRPSRSNSCGTDV